MKFYLFLKGISHPNDMMNLIRISLWQTCVHFAVNQINKFIQHLFALSLDSFLFLYHITVCSAEKKREKSAIKNAVTVSLTRPSSYHSLGILQLHILPFTYSFASVTFADFFQLTLFKSTINLEREEKWINWIWNVDSHRNIQIIFIHSIYLRTFDKF